MDWTGLLRFEMNPWELVLRGTLMYWFIYLLFRFVLRRDVGSIAIADILLLVLIADASQNALAGGYTPRALQANADVTRKINGEILTGRVLISNPVLAGDTIYIRERLF